MAAALSPNQDFVQRRLCSIHAEDALFKSLQGLQQEGRQQRKNSMGAGRGQQQRQSTAPRRNTSHRAKQPNSIGGRTSGVSQRARSSDGRTPRNAATSLGAQSCHGMMCTKPRSLSQLEDCQTSGRKPRQTHRLGRRSSTGMASDAGSRAEAPAGLNSNLQSNVRFITPTGSEINNARRSSGGALNRMRQQSGNGSIPESFSSCIQTNVRLLTAEPSSAKTQSSDANPRRMRRRGSTGLAPQTNPTVTKARRKNGALSVSLHNGASRTSQSLGMFSGGATGLASQTNPPVTKTRRKNGALSVSLHNGASRTPQSLGMEDILSSGGAAARRMLRRGSTGMAQVVNPRVVPKGVKNMCRSQSSNDAVKISPNGEGMRSTGQRNMDWGWGTSTGPGGKSPAATKRKKSRVRQRTSSTMDQVAKMDTSGSAKQTTRNPEKPGSKKGKGRTKSRSSRPEEAAGAPVVMRSFKRSGTNTSSGSMTSTTSAMSTTSFENFVWGEGDIVAPTGE